MGLSIRELDFPTGLAYVGHPHAHPGPSYRPECDMKDTKEEEVPVYQTRQVILPFDLRDHSINALGPDMLPLLQNIFPDTIEVARTVFGLAFALETLPPKPWPLTVGGLPVKIWTETEGRMTMFPRFPAGQSQVQACKDFNLGGERKLTWTQLEKIGTTLVQHLSKENPNVRISEVLAPYDGNFYVVLSNDVSISANLSKLPRRIAGRFAFYLLDQDIGRPAYASDLFARRTLQPDPLSQLVDDTAYDTLRPGVMVCSPDGGGCIQTTAGVCVRDKHGNEFMTVASHGIGNTSRICYPPPGTQRTFGSPILEVPYTDIALVKLHDDVNFSNQTFDNPEGVTPIFSHLQGENQNDNIIDQGLYTSVFMNNPWTGYLDGQLVASSVRMLAPEYRGEEGLEWVRYDWSFQGDDGTVQSPPSACGSAVWNDRGKILGFYQFHIVEGQLAGFCVSGSASHLVNFGEGYRLAV